MDVGGNLSDRISTRTTRTTRKPAVDPSAWLADLLAVIGARRIGRKFQCPVHALTGEHTVALATGPRTDGTGAWIHCHAGCELDAVLRALHLTRADLRNPPPVTPARHAKAWKLTRPFPPPKMERGDEGAGWVAVAIAEHAYGDPTPFAWKVRERNAAGTKRMHWVSLNPRGEKVPGLLGRSEADMPLYRIREVRMAVAMEEPIVLVESESSVDALSKAGIYATTWAGGASSPPLARLSGELGGARVLLVPDNDEAGLACRDRIVRVLPEAEVRLGEQGEDARDILARCGSEWFR